MADMFCSSCQYGDQICDALFCDPSRLIVTMVMTTMGAICQTMEHTHLECYQEFCDGFTRTSSRSKRQTVCTEFEPTEQFTGVSGMSEWCQNMCTKGHCPITHCQCVQETGTIERDIDKDTSSMSGVTMTTISSTSSTASSTTILSTTANRWKVSDNITDEASFDVISSIVCEHGKVYQQNQLTDRYCQTEDTVISYEEENDQDILDQVQAVGPQLMCALSNQSGQSERCSSMFCGESSTASLAIQMSMCSVCEQFSDVLSTNCVKTYCL